VNGRLKAVVDSTLSLVDIADCTTGHLLAATRGQPGERYVLSGATLTVREGLALLGRLAGIERPVRTLRPSLAMTLATAVESVAWVRRGSPRICRELARTITHGHAYDGSKAERELGLRYTPIETLRRTMDWWIEQDSLPPRDTRPREHFVESRRLAPNDRRPLDPDRLSPRQHAPGHYAAAAEGRQHPQGRSGSSERRTSGAQPASRSPSASRCSTLPKASRAALLDFGPAVNSSVCRNRRASRPPAAGLRARQGRKIVATTGGVARPSRRWRRSRSRLGLRVPPDPLYLGRLLVSAATLPLFALLGASWPVVASRRSAAAICAHLTNIARLLSRSENRFELRRASKARG
jgi:hypothetical protein